MTDQRIFISHASEDEAVVGRIVAYLEAHGVPCWISSRDIPPRSIYADAIVEGMQACSACAVIVSAAANQSKAVKRELELASHEDKPFIPIRIDATEPAAGLAYYLRNAQWVDYRRDGDRALDRIVAQLKGAPTPAAPARRRKPQVRDIAIVGAFAVAMVALAAFVLVPRITSHQTRGAVATLNTAQKTSSPQPLANMDRTSEYLVGAYSWDGVDCFSGPTVTVRDGIISFAMTNAPTYRHAILRSSIDGGELRLETRVFEPEEQAGTRYLLVRNLSSSAMSVTSRGHTDLWQRCADRDSTIQALERELQAINRERARRAAGQISASP